MLIIILIITVAYLILIGSLVYGFDRVPDIKLKDTPVQTKFSVIIPFRNESKNLPTLLKSLAHLHYPETRFEVLLVNDDSTDNSVQLITTFISNLDTIKPSNIRIINNKRLTTSPKKDAITTAMSHANYQWIVTTDADCKLPKYWLDVFDHCAKTTEAKMLVAPVSFRTANSFFERFQLLDILSLQGATIGGFGIKKPFLCNGANLAYRKDLFDAINGFEGNADIASGDDIFMLEKVIKHSKSSIKYVKNKEVIVTTQAQINFKALKSQRVRWAAKTSRYKNTFGKLAGFLVLLMNALLVCLPLLCILQVIPLKTLIYIFAIKCLIDFLLLYKTARFFNQEAYLPTYLFSSVLYPFFSVYVASIAVFKGYRWKGRPFTK